GTNYFDLTQPNPLFWQHVDRIVDTASANGFEVLMGLNNDPGIGYTYSSNPIANFTAYGQFLGQRYANRDNIIWEVPQGDYAESPQGDAQIAAVIQGIRQYDTRHLMTGQGWYTSAYPHTSFGNATLRPYMNIDGIYHETYFFGPYRGDFLQEYNRS